MCLLKNPVIYDVFATIVTGVVTGLLRVVSGVLRGDSDGKPMSFFVFLVIIFHQTIKLWMVIMNLQMHTREIANTNQFI